MDILRRNTDYALRAMLNLTRHWQHDAVSTRDISNEEDISYQLACKLMQMLRNAELVVSSMGAKGGFSLSREPSEITIRQIIEAIQGAIYLNKCMSDDYDCQRQGSCIVRQSLVVLQDYVDDYFSKTTLADLVRAWKGNYPN